MTSENHLLSHFLVSYVSFLKSPAPCLLPPVSCPLSHISCPEAYAGFWRGRGEHLPTPPPPPQGETYIYISYIWMIWWLLPGMIGIKKMRNFKRIQKRLHSSVTKCAWREFSKNRVFFKNMSESQTFKFFFRNNSFQVPTFCHWAMLTFLESP